MLTRRFRKVKIFDVVGRQLLGTEENCENLKIIQNKYIFFILIKISFIFGAECWNGNFGFYQNNNIFNTIVHNIVAYFHLKVLKSIFSYFIAIWSSLSLQWVMWSP